MQPRLQFDTISKRIEKYLGLPALLVGFVVDTLALLAVFGVQTGSSESSIFLGPIPQLTIWTPAFIPYLGYLRGYWSKQVSISTSSISREFTQVVFSDIPRFHYPFFLIPVAILIGFLFNLLRYHPGTTLAFLWLSTSAVLLISYRFRQVEKRTTEEKAE